MRFNIELPVNMPKDEIIRMVLADERSKKWIGNGNCDQILLLFRTGSLI